MVGGVSLVHSDLFSWVNRKTMADQKLLSVEEISKHNTAEDCWIVVDGQVWDITEFAPEHPGGGESKT